MAVPRRSSLVLAAFGWLFCTGWASAFDGPEGGALFAPVRPSEASQSRAAARLVQACDLVRAAEARRGYGVSGQGLSVAILDTGLLATHVDFAGKIIVQRNFTSDNGADPANATDGHGHGTHVAGIVCANGLHIGVAPEADVVVLKVINNDGRCTFSAVDRALQWVLDNRQAYRIAVVNLSLVDGRNHASWGSDPIRAKIQALREARVPVVACAGNEFYTVASQKGMGFPAILPETISVGAVYDANMGEKWYADGAKAFSTAPDRIAPFSQRLPEGTGEAFQTDLFAPGAPMESTGISSDEASSSMQGTSQAAPMVSGAILLLQEGYLRNYGELPTVAQLEGWLTAGSQAVVDGDDEDDNVTNTAAVFRRLDVRGALESAGLPETGLSWLSEPSATPAPAVVGMPIEFSALVASASAEGPSYRWDFGDGSSSVGSTAQHVYAEAGDYTVTVLTTVSGFEHSESFPLSVMGASELEITRFAAKLNFAKAGRDALSVSGRIDPRSSSIAEGAQVRMDVGGLQVSFEVDGRGKGRCALGTIALNPKGNFTLKLKGGPWQPAWSDEGLVNDTVHRGGLEMKVVLWIDGVPYANECPLAYTGKSGKSGKAKFMP